MTPAPSVRLPFFAAISPLCLRSAMRALSMSPFASSSAFFTCMTDTPVSSRSSLICSMVISIYSELKKVNNENLNRKPLKFSSRQKYLHPLLHSRLIGIAQDLKKIPNGKQGGIIGKDRVRDLACVAVGIQERDRFHFYLLRFHDRDVFFARVDNNQRRRGGFEIGYSAKLRLESPHFTLE